MTADSYMKPQLREKVTFRIHLKFFVSFFLITSEAEMYLHILIPLVCRQAFLAILDP